MRAQAQITRVVEWKAVVKALGDPKLSFIGPNVTVSSLPYALGAAIGVIYGVFVEVDDGSKKKNAPSEPPKKS